jgi:lysyl-tRNA synthetase, class I
MHNSKQIETTDTISKYWLDLVVASVIAAHPNGEIVVSSGISPSASYHIGHFREVLTADAITRGLKAVGRKARHIHVVDNMDPLRKRYSFLPEEYERYVGWPICLIPSPFKKNESYATHYFNEFRESAARMGVEYELVRSYEDQYQTGAMVPYIEQALEQIPTITGIFEQLSGRRVAADWAPIQIVSDSNSLTDWRYVALDKAKKTIRYRDASGVEGDLDYTRGRVKLNWRLDWPARWALQGVMVEPFGKEHATKGGSYETGVGFVEQVFGAKAPYPVPYDTINLLGDNKKMSSSLGNLVTPAQALEIMPPEILRYFVLKSRPSKVVYFDSGVGVYNLIGEYAGIEADVRAGRANELREAYQMASAGASERTISSVPFDHLVSVYQAARGDRAEVMAILERTGYQQAVAEESEVLGRELVYVANWVEKFAPDSVRIELQEAMPSVRLSVEQRAFLGHLGSAIEATTSKSGAVSTILDGPAMHQLIYDATQKASLMPQKGFSAIYQIILARDSGPKAGWFLASLDRLWLIARLREASVLPK